MKSAGSDKIISIQTPIGKLSYELFLYRDGGKDNIVYEISLDSRKRVIDGNGNKSSHGTYKVINLKKDLIDEDIVQKIHIIILNYDPEESTIKFGTDSHSFHATTMEGRDGQVVRDMDYSDILRNDRSFYGFIDCFTNTEYAVGGESHEMELQGLSRSRKEPMACAKLKLDRLEVYDFGVHYLDVNDIIEFSNAFLRNNRTITFVKYVLDSLEAELPGITQIIMNNGPLMPDVMDIMESKKNPEISPIVDELLLRGSVEACNLPGEESFVKIHR